MAVIILAGGLSSRFGREKASLAVGGHTILQSLVSRFARKLGPVVVVMRPDQDLKAEQAVVARDIYHSAGPLGGLHAGLLASPDDDNFALACDMPFADPELARYLISLLGDHDAVVPRLALGLEPLHAVYRKSCLPRIEENLKAGGYRIKEMLDGVNCLYVPEDEIRKWDPELRGFVNINTYDEYLEALQFSESMRDHEL